MNLFRSRGEKSQFETCAKYMQNVCAGFVFLTSRLWLPAGLHTNQSTAAWHLRHASKQIWLVLRHPASFCVSLCLLSNKRAGKFSFSPLAFNATPPTAVLVWLASGPSSLNAWESRVVLFSWLDVTCFIFFFFCLLFYFRDVPVRSDIYRLGLPLHGQHTGERTEIKPDEQHSQNHIGPAEILYLRWAQTHTATQTHGMAVWHTCVFLWNLNKLNKKDLGLVSPSAFCINQQ